MRQCCLKAQIGCQRWLMIIKHAFLAHLTCTLKEIAWFCTPVVQPNYSKQLYMICWFFPPAFFIIPNRNRDWTVQGQAMKFEWVSAHDPLYIHVYTSLSQPVNCIFWPIRVLYKNREPRFTGGWRYCPHSAPCVQAIISTLKNHSRQSQLLYQHLFFKLRVRT